MEFVIRLAQGMDERLPSLAADLVAHKPDVIVAVTSSATRAAKAATTAIPIVMVQVSDPDRIALRNQFRTMVQSAIID